MATTPGSCASSFPRAGRRQPDLGEVDWDRFFRTFDDRKLAFLYQERTADGQISRFNKFVDRDQGAS